MVEDGSDERELLFRLFEKLLLDPERFVQRPERILPGADERFEFLCTKGGKGSLAIDGVLLVVKQAKALPSSD